MFVLVPFDIQKKKIILMFVAVTMKVVTIFLSVAFVTSYSLPIGGLSSSGSLGSTAILTPFENLGESVDNAVSTFARSKVSHVIHEIIIINS